MANNAFPPSNRRDFLHLGILAGMLGIAGCGEEGAVQKIDTPPADGGNRNRLDKIKDRAAELPVKKKK